LATFAHRITARFEPHNRQAFHRMEMLSKSASVSDASTTGFGVRHYLLACHVAILK